MLRVALEQLISPLSTAAQPLPPVIQAHRFELVDATGASRGVLRMAPEGTGPEVALLDEAGQGRATMTQNSDGEYAFLIFDPGGSPRFGVGTTMRGFVGLNVRDGRGVVRSNLYASDDGSDTGFRTWDADGRVHDRPL
ncbi:MAG: hypothetical protein M3069_02670 [Chloroflexota bacterium]|nr:hypothetical protein [Chloroflexota bacterium]